MKCSNCENIISDDAKFCMHCGTKIAVAERKCPWCYISLSGNPSFCPSCGGNTDALVFTHLEVAQLQQMFDKAGYRANFDKSELRQLSLLPKEEIITFIERAKSGLIGAVDKGKNSFTDLTIDGYLHQKGPFSTLITNNRFHFIEPQRTIAYEQISGYEFNPHVDKFAVIPVFTAQPEFSMDVSGKKIYFKASLTTGTGIIGNYFSWMKSLAEIQDSSMGDDSAKNREAAFLFINAVGELFRTLSDHWQP